MPPIPAGEGLWQWGVWDGTGPQTEDPRFKLMQFNMCGSACNKGANKVAEAVVRSLLARLPDVVILNEVCLTQVDLIWSKVGERGLLTAGCFAASSGQTQCPGEPGERWYGNAVFTTGMGLGKPKLIRLPNDEQAREQRNAVTMETMLRGSQVLLAGTHLATESNDYHARQIDAVVRRFVREASERPVIMGGDFNVTRDRLEELYESGAFTEVDVPNNVRTYRNRKIDYLFLSSAHFDEVSGKVTRSAYSDHRPLLGEARLRS